MNHPALLTRNQSSYGNSPLPYALTKVPTPVVIIGCNKDVISKCFDAIDLTCNRGGINVIEIFIYEVSILQRAEEFLQEGLVLLQLPSSHDRDALKRIDAFLMASIHCKNLRIIPIIPLNDSFVKHFRYSGFFDSLYLTGCSEVQEYAQVFDSLITTKPFSIECIPTRMNIYQSFLQGCNALLPKKKPNLQAIF